MAEITNIAAYKFAHLEDLKTLREELLRLCKEQGLRGTILLSTEGINLFVAGSREGVTFLLDRLRRVSGLETLEVKESASQEQPFNRMLVRIKKEIIAFGVPGIDPAQRTSPKLPARVLKEWLDEGRPLTLLDTRNDYEVKLGTFENAVPAGIDHFRDFPEAVGRLPEGMKEQPIVMFCTGGIRCEKAGPYMEMQGFKNVYQLEGGILKYFEEVGGAHYKGECFVFDQRVGVDPALRETESGQCFCCLAPLTAEEQQDPRFVAGKSCPYCFKTSEQERAERIARRQEAITKATNPLPGSLPYDNYRPISVPESCDGVAVLEFLRRVLPHVPPTEWEALVGKSLLVNAKREPVSLEACVRGGERIYQKLPSIVEPPVNGGIRLLHEDEALIVIDKPAPLPVHAGGRFNRNTVQYILNEVYYPQKPKPAHRLDANTSGVMVLTRTRHFAAKLQPQFARGEVVKRYLTLVRGLPAEDHFVCEAPISAEPSETGSRTVDGEAGLAARTEFRVLRRNSNGTTLVEALPTTGRTNQIRVHLWNLGYPICGDPTYLEDQGRGEMQTLPLDAPPMCLHSLEIEFTDPTTQERVRFSAPAPPWAGAPEKI